MADYLRARRSRREPFLRSISDMHLLLYLCNMLDMKVDMPVLCSKVTFLSSFSLSFLFLFSLPWDRSGATVPML